MLSPTRWCHVQPSFVSQLCNKHSHRIHPVLAPCLRRDCTFATVKTLNYCRPATVPCTPPSTSTTRARGSGWSSTPADPAPCSPPTSQGVVCIDSRYLISIHTYNVFNASRKSIAMEVLKIKCTLRPLTTHKWRWHYTRHRAHILAAVCDADNVALLSLPAAAHPSLQCPALVSLSPHFSLAHCNSRFYKPKLHKIVKDPYADRKVRKCGNFSFKILFQTRGM